MKRKITILRQYFLELIEATERRDFVAMNEIYCEIESIMHNKTLNNIFFSQLDNDKIVLPNCVGNHTEDSISLEALLYKDSECLELHLNSLSLEKWQENFLNKNFSAKFKKILRIERNIIVLDDETRDFLNITDGDIIKFDLSNGIIISKFNIQKLWLSLNL
ncbi:hypothetical protein [Qingrenia yutianensis]|uniref:Uncharacterized protein n=1 Tax=Qingrenia yutianensis TaxID=2763676 RepID=A0A926FFR9_9FIRM|nr:hypothetical protein [Qingrenia yutianensis]MBC8597444.1 hypothetical protein [Qingrenia yutianensis]